MVLTVTVATAVFVAIQPNALVPVTEYDVFTNGLTTLLPDEYVYVLAPDGVIVKDLPEQITPELTVIVGFGFTLILNVLVLLHNPGELPITV